MAQLSQSVSERRAESFGQRRSSHVDREPKRFRLAGELFGVDVKNKARAQKEKSRQRLQSVRAVGVGFGERDNYGPDNSWDTKDPIKYTPSPDYYSARRSA